ncbi:hypothetical protein BD311DRAFT_266400 [Dichomitus squalens]|uniref:Uncharacterized protein n=1 Tax=Dichomitus squalens TaxID=114155 RepID=A0A4Q9MPH3_9APHY|nr:hypothetical protein BD311DRAFT_266400 [Dichomitus squalens]
MYAASTTLRSTSKTVLRRYPVVARRVAGRRTSQRFQSSSTGFGSGTGSSTSYDASHLAAGLAGGSVVLLGVYAWYHLSGTKKVVQSTQKAAQYYEQAKQAIAEKTPKDPNEALDYLRSFAQSYLVVIPGARPHIDAAFDTIDQLRDSHGDEVNRVVGDGYEEVRVIIRDSGAMDASTAMRVLDVLRRRSGELEELGKKAGKDAFGSLSEKYPQVSEKLGGGYEEFKRLAKSKGPEAKKIFDDTAKQIREIFSKGFSQDSINQARELVQSKTSEVRKIVKASSQEAWNKSIEEASPYLDNIPEIKQLLNDNASAFIAAGATGLTGGSSSTQELFSRIKDLAQGDALKNKEKMNELRDFVKEKAHEAEEQGSQELERGWQSLQEWIRTMPGGDEALERLPDVKVFVQVSREKSDEAKKLVKETYEGVLRVLEEKGKKAKQLAGEVQDDSKKRS